MSNNEQKKCPKCGSTNIQPYQKHLCCYGCGEYFKAGEKYICVANGSCPNDIKREHGMEHYYDCMECPHNEKLTEEEAESWKQKNN